MVENFGYLLHTPAMEENNNIQEIHYRFTILECQNRLSLL